VSDKRRTLRPKFTQDLGVTSYGGDIRRVLRDAVILDVTESQKQQVAATEDRKMMQSIANCLGGIAKKKAEEGGFTRRILPTMPKPALFDDGVDILDIQPIGGKDG
jgi:hypothetical protein